MNISIWRLTPKTNLKKNFGLKVYIKKNISSIALQIFNNNGIDYLSTNKKQFLIQVGRKHFFFFFFTIQMAKAIWEDLITTAVIRVNEAILHNFLPSNIRVFCKIIFSRLPLAKHYGY